MNLTRHCAVIVALAMAGGAWAAEDEDGPTELSPLEVEAQPLALPKVRIRPPYPQLARRNWLEGCVLLQYTIREDGLTDDFAILESHPVGVFEEGVIKAVLRWEFEPRDEPRVQTEVFEFRHPTLGASATYMARGASRSVTKPSTGSPGGENAGRTTANFSTEIKKIPTCDTEGTEVAS